MKSALLASSAKYLHKSAWCSTLLSFCSSRSRESCLCVLSPTQDQPAQDCCTGTGRRRWQESASGMEAPGSKMSSVVPRKPVEQLKMEVCPAPSSSHPLPTPAVCLLAHGVLVPCGVARLTEYSGWLPLTLRRWWRSLGCSPSTTTRSSMCRRRSSITTQMVTAAWTVPSLPRWPPSWPRRGWTSRDGRRSAPSMPTPPDTWR